MAAPAGPWARRIELTYNTGMYERPRAKWWQLYVMLPLLVGLLWLEMQIPLTPTENVIAQIGILFLIFGFVQLWLSANGSALTGLDEDGGRRRSKLYEIPPVFPRTLDDVEDRVSERPMLHIPAAGVKGVLSDTFEWEVPENPPAPSVKGAVSREK
jgi:hypothetical protein